MTRPSHISRSISRNALRGAAALALTAIVPLSLAAQAPLSNTNPAAIAKARSDSARYPYTTADIAFMTGMIGHHSQAIAMSKMAPTHGAGPSVQRLAERIINAQQDEIVTMQNWLRDRNQPVPDGQYHMEMKMDMPMPGMAGMHQETLMPGMLTPDQMKELDSSRDASFDRHFLTFMMQHHRGAITMVRDLFNSYGAAQDETVFKFANDVNVDQTTEIARMELMFFQVPPDTRAP
jgi:uncharacterized protein (DUF305 family)